MENVSEITAPVESFEPSKSTKLAWRFTRKTSVNIAGIQLPGLFQTSGYSIDVAAFFTVLGLEVYGLYNLLVVGRVIFVYIACIFLLDIVLATGRHWPTAHIIEARNKIIAISATRKLSENTQVRRSRDEEAMIGQAQLENGIFWRRLLINILTIFIFCVAFLKIIFFYATQGGQITGVTAAIVVSYFLTATLHVTNTGYFVFGFAWHTLQWLDQRAHRLSSKRRERYRINQWRETRFETLGTVKPTSSGVHKIEKEAENLYNLRTWGVLTDRELYGLVQAQADLDARGAIVRAGLHTQLEILRTDPAP